MLHKLSRPCRNLFFEVERLASRGVSLLMIYIPPHCREGVYSAVLQPYYQRALSEPRHCPELCRHTTVLVRSNMERCCNQNKERNAVVTRIKKEVPGRNRNALFILIMAKQWRIFWSLTPRRVESSMNWLSPKSWTRIATKYSTLSDLCPSGQTCRPMMSPEHSPEGLFVVKIWEFVAGLDHSEKRKEKLSCHHSFPLRPSEQLHQPSRITFSSALPLSRSLACRLPSLMFRANTRRSRTWISSEKEDRRRLDSIVPDFSSERSFPPNDQLSVQVSPSKAINIPVKKLIAAGVCTCRRSKKKGSSNSM